MEKRKKSIIEENKASMSKKIGKYAVIVVLYIALVSTLAFIIGTINLIVNADSINTEPSYQYMTESYYNWDNITWRTSDNTIVTGSNDTFSTLESWSDYYFVEEEREETAQYVNSLIVYWGNSTSSTQIVFNFPTGLTDTLYVTDTFTDLGGVMYAEKITYIDSTNLQFRLYVSSIGVTTIGFRGDNWGYRPTPKDSFFNNITGNTLLNETLFAPYTWSSDDWPSIDGPSASINYRKKDNNIMTLSNIIPLATETISYSIKRDIIYNSDLSTLDTFVYDSTLVTDLKFTSIAFEKNNFFLKVGDLNRVGSPQIFASVLSGGYDISYDIIGYVKSNTGETRNINIVTDKREDVLGYQYLLPSKLELFGNVESVDNDSMMYIEKIRVLVEFPNNYANSLSYRYGVDSIEYNSLNYDGAMSNWVNSSIGINMGDILLDNVNAFLQFEILPNFTLFNLFVLIVAIPLLIWILKLILGG